VLRRERVEIVARRMRTDTSRNRRRRRRRCYYMIHGPASTGVGRKIKLRETSGAIVAISRRTRRAAGWLAGSTTCGGGGTVCRLMTERARRRRGDRK